MKVLIAGYGSIGARHLASLRRLYPSFEYGVLRSGAGSTPSPEGVKVFTSVAQLSSFKPDLLFVCSPTALHADTLEEVLPFLAPGCSVFMEKPLAASPGDIERIRSLISKAGAGFQYGCVFRHHPLILAAKEQLGSSQLGGAISYSLKCTSWLPDWRPGQDYRKGYSANKAMGGGVALDLIHEFDYAEFLFGPASRLDGTCTKASDLEIDCHDECKAVAYHPKVDGIIELSFGSRVNQRFFEIVCQDGIISGDLLNGELTVAAKGEKRKNTFTLTRDELFDRQTRAVVEACKAGDKDLSRLDEASALNLKVIELIAKGSV